MKAGFKAWLSSVASGEYISLQEWQKMALIWFLKSLIFLHLLERMIVVDSFAVVEELYSTAVKPV